MTDIKTILTGAQTVGDALANIKDVVEIVIMTQPFLVAAISKKSDTTTTLLGKQSTRLQDGSDVALLIQVGNRPAHYDVAQFLEANDMDIPFFVINWGKTDLDPMGLKDDDQDSWTTAAQAFVDQIHEIQSVYGSRRRYHLFLTGPLALSFALGTTVGTLYPIKVYNFNRESESTQDAYLQVLDIKNLKAK